MTLTAILTNADASFVADVEAGVDLDGLVTAYAHAIRAHATRPVDFVRMNRALIERHGLETLIDVKRGAFALLEDPTND